MAKPYRLTARRMAALRKAQLASARKRRRNRALAGAAGALAVAGIGAAGYGGYKLNIRNRNRNAVKNFIEKAKTSQLALPIGLGRPNLTSFSGPKVPASRRRVTGKNSKNNRLIYGLRYKVPSIKTPSGIRNSASRINGRSRGSSITRGRVSPSGRLKLHYDSNRYGGFFVTRNEGDMSKVVVKSTTHNRVIKVNSKGKAIVTTGTRIKYDANRRNQYRQIVGPKKPKKRRVRTKAAKSQVKRVNNVVSLYAFKQTKRRKGK